MGDERDGAGRECLLLLWPTETRSDFFFQGTLYLEDANSPTKLANKAASESSYKLQSYYGYSFEAFSTSPPSSTSSPTFSPPNTNVQWCSIVKTNLGGFRTILGGEVDCVLPTANIKRIKADDFVELKTNIIISSPRDEMMFERCGWRGVASQRTR
jgi:RAT1-interacting protein